MNAERIERLVMDRALGELNEDVTVLLDTYLAEHPEARQWAEDMAATCAVTRRAVDARTQEKAADRPAAGIRFRRPGQIHWAAVGRWAALVAISVSLGAVLGRWFQPQTAAPGRVVVQAERATATANGWQRLASQEGQGFWKSQALALLQTKPYENSLARDSRASFWGKYKPSRKERSYE